MKKVFTSILLLAALSVPAYLSASAWLEGEDGNQTEHTLGKCASYICDTAV